MTSKKLFVDKLEESGVIDKLSECIVNLYSNPKPPPEVYQFFLSTLNIQENTDIEKLLNENQDLRKTIVSLKAQISELESKTKK